MNLVSHLRIKTLIIPGLLSLVSPLYAAVTYDGADGVRNNIFYSNTVEACINCHSSANVGDTARYYAPICVNFDTYAWATHDVDNTATVSGQAVNNTICDPYDVPAGTIVNLANHERGNTRVQGSSMPIKRDLVLGAPNVIYPEYPDGYLNTAEKALMQGWIDGGAPQYVQPTKQTNAVTSIGKYAATLHATLNRNAWSYSNNPATTTDTRYLFQIKPSLSSMWTNPGSYLYSNAYNEGTKTISDGGIDTSKSQFATNLSCGTQYDVRIFYQFQYYGGSWYDGSIYGGGTGNTTTFNTVACPNITTISLPAATESTFYQTTINATQTGPSQSFSFVGTPPAGMSINNSGVLSWTSPPQAKSNYTVNFTVRVSDGTTVDDQAYSLLVNADNDPPVINSSAPSTGVESNLYSYAVSVSDPDDTNNGVDLSFSLLNEPAGMAVSSTGTITWTPGNGVTTSGSVTLTVQDAVSSDSEIFTIAVNGVNNSPAITPGAPSTATEDIVYSYQLDVTDIDDPNDGTNLQYSLTNSPAGMTISNTGVIQWTPLEGVTTSGTFTATVSDGGENSSTPASEIITITVTPVNDAPQITSVAGTSVIEENLYSYQLAIIDPDDTDTANDLTLSLENNPAGMAISSTGLISWTPARYTTTSGIVTVRVADGGEDSAQAATEIFTIAVSIIDADTDNVADYNDNCPAVSNTDQLNTDGDSEGDACDLDDDNDGMPDTFETVNNLDPLVNDATLDKDGDGVSNLDEYLNGTNADLDDIAPVLIIPADISVIATGYLTEVDLGIATATDFKYGVVRAYPDKRGPFVAGRHTITWSAVDGRSNLVSATQTVDVTPLVNFAVDQLVAEGSVVTVNYELSGEAVSYPVVIDYSVAGNADNNDHDAVNATVNILSGTKGSFSFNVASDAVAETAEIIVFSITNVQNAVVGAKSTHIVSIADGNLAPQVDLSISQATSQGHQLYLDQGDVTVTASVNDPNGDVVVYDWSDSSTELVAINGTGTSSSNLLQFDVTGLAEGNYTVDVLVSDGLSTTHVTALVHVVASGPVLTSSDSDADGVDDVTETAMDSDGDGIGDYLDAIVQAYVLQNQTGSLADQLLLTTDTGLKIQLGSYALAGNRKGALIIESDILNLLGVSSIAGAELVGSSSIYDFEVSEIRNSNQPVKIVLPLSAAIQSGARVYMLDSQNGWVPFVENNVNKLSSARSLGDNLCPLPGDYLYNDALSLLNNCVQLTVEDGGPNDMDREINGRIRMTVTVDYPQQITATDNAGAEPADVGVLHPLMLFYLLLSAGLWRLIARVRVR